jgi:hypothetical protein
MGDMNYSVVVDPRRWDDDTEELARRVARLTRHDVQRVQHALGRGAMTVDSDLSEDRARSLATRLAGLEVPGQIDGPDGSHVFGPERAAPEASTPAGQSAESGETSSDWGSVLGEETEPLDEDPGDDESLQEAESFDFGAVPVEEADDEVAEVEAEPRDPDPPPEPRRDPVPGDESGPEEFDGLAMHEALGDSSESKADESTYSDRWEHLPPLASLLSLLAPGAGQIYNGDRERGRELVWKALLVWPWAVSVLRAWRTADAILEGKRPRPERGSLRSALGRVGLWWAAIGCLVTVGVIGSELTEGMPDARQQQARSESLQRADRTAALTEGRMIVQDARMDASEAATRKRRESERFTMSRAERADRLFRIGLEHCRAHEYGVCHSAMKKVATLDARYRRDAYRLQSWASLQQDPDTPDRPMPEIQVEAPSLSEYETDSLRQIEGMERAGDVGLESVGTE